MPHPAWASLQWNRGRDRPRSARLHPSQIPAADTVLRLHECDPRCHPEAVPLTSARWHLPSWRPTLPTFLSSRKKERLRRCQGSSLLLLLHAQAAAHRCVCPAQLQLQVHPRAGRHHAARAQTSHCRTVRRAARPDPSRGLRLGATRAALLGRCWASFIDQAHCRLGILAAR